MSLELWIALGLLACFAFIMYRIRVGKRIEKLEREVRDMQTRYYEADAIAARNGK